MRERPILFSGPMVRAILEGRKTVTRRLVKYHPMLGEPEQWCASARAREPGWMHIVGDYTRFCPYGVAGDRLWVRETFAPDYFERGRPGYRADWSDRAADVCPEPRWKPSIFMRRHESRILLEVVDVRVERLGDITEGDAAAEGLRRTAAGTFYVDTEPGRVEEFADGRTAFAFLWDGINGKRAEWASNPWVWRVEFTPGTVPSGHGVR